MTSTDWFEIVLIVLLIAAVGVLGASEVAITRANRVRAYRLLEEKRRGANSLAKIADNPAPYLNVVLLLTLLSTIGGTTIATSLAVRRFDGAGEVVATIVMTLLLFVFADVTPKTFAIQQTDRVGLFLAPLLVGLGRLVGPIATGLVKLANVIMPGKGLPQGPFITEQELRASAEVASEEGVIEEGEKELFCHSGFGPLPVICRNASSTSTSVSLLLSNLKTIFAKPSKYGSTAPSKASSTFRALKPRCCGS